MHVRRAAAAVAPPLTLLLALLSSCSDSDEPNAEPTDDITLPTPSSSSAAPEPEPETAKEFIRRYQQAVDDMQNTGDFKEYRAITKGCYACRPLTTRVKGIYKRGGSIEFQGTRVLSISRQSNGKRPIFDVRVRSGDTAIVERRGGKEKTLKGAEYTLRLTLQRGQNGWLVYDMAEVPS